MEFNGTVEDEKKLILADKDLSDKTDSSLSCETTDLARYHLDLVKSLFYSGQYGLLRNLNDSERERLYLGLDHIYSMIEKSRRK
jgi:hypothetical protein